MCIRDRVGPALRAMLDGMECAVKTIRVVARRAGSSVPSAALTASACGSTKPGWSWNCRSLLISGAFGPTALRAAAMSSQYCLQEEYPP